MKRKVLGIAAAGILSLGLIVSANSAIRVFLDGRELNFDTPVRIEDGTALAPIRVIAEELGASVNWDSETKSIIINSKGNKALEQRAMLLEQALMPKNQDSAATLWAEGVKMRNGALQYAVLSPILKQEKYPEFEAMNWSTGVSSPWIESYNVAQKGKLDDNTFIYQVKFLYTDSNNNTFEELQNIVVSKYASAWLVSSIERVDVLGEITKVTLGDKEKSPSIFVENKSGTLGSYDKATVVITKDTKIYKDFTNQIVSVDDLKEGQKVEAVFEGPVLMMYPVQGGAKTIRVLE